MSYEHNKNVWLLGYKGNTWLDGYAKVGAGQTWGLNFWWNLENSVGVYKLAAENNREMVGGKIPSGKNKV